MPPLANRTAIVTGASRGIGRAIALALADAGANLVAVATNEALLAELCAAASAKGVQALPHACDIAAPDAADKAVEAALAKFGRLDVLVNNAGITRDNLLLRMKDDEWTKVLDVNLTAAYRFLKAVTRPMMKQRGGRIVNIVSVVGLMGNAGQANYAASKGGLIALTKSVARELASRAITVNAVAPGFITTDMTAQLPEDAKKGLLDRIPLARLGTPEDVAAAVAFLASDAASYITGQVLSVDGGMYM